MGTPDYTIGQHLRGNVWLVRKQFNFAWGGIEIVFERRGLAAPDPTPAEIGRQLRPYVTYIKDIDAAVYALSKVFSPPEINLRDGEIADDYGDESRHPTPMNHLLPEDPTREQLETYFNGYAFMGGNDLLFYLYAWVRALSEDENIGGMPDYYFYGLGWRLPDLVKELDEAQLLVLYCGLLALWERMEYPLNLDWRGSDHLLKFLGVEADPYGEHPNSHGNPTAWCSL